MAVAVAATTITSIKTASSPTLSEHRTLTPHHLHLTAPANAAQIPPTSPPKTQPPPLLALPPELRLQIWTWSLRLSSPSTPRPAPTTYHLSNPCLSDSLPGLALLLANRQIHAEARLLPFQTNAFTFIKWYGSSVYNCKRWLEKLAPWQRRAVRVLDVWVAGREVVELWRREEGWCSLIGLLGGGGEGGEVDGGVLLRAHVRRDDVSGVSRVRAGLEGCLKHDLEPAGKTRIDSPAAVRGAENDEMMGRVRLEIVIEDVVLGEDAKKEEKEKTELVEMSGWADGIPA